MPCFIAADRPLVSQGPIGKIILSPENVSLLERTSFERPSACRSFGNVDVTIICKADIGRRAVLIRCAAEVTVSMRRH